MKNTDLPILLAPAVPVALVPLGIGLPFMPKSDDLRKWIILAKKKAICLPFMPSHLCHLCQHGLKKSIILAIS